MFQLPISSVETTLLAGALCTWAILLFGGFLFGKLNEQQTRRMPVWTRLLSSVTLVFGGWIWFSISRGTPVANLATWLAVGMTLGFLGDIFLVRVLSIEPHIIYGMVAFGLGHIAYIVGMLFVTPSAAWPSPLAPAVFIWWLIALVLWYVIVFRKSKKSVEVYLALPYSLLLATTAGLAVSLALTNPAFILVAIGAVLFLLSDLVLAAELFNDLHFTSIGDVVWLLYGPAQMLIVFGVFLYAVFDGLIAGV